MERAGAWFASLQSQQLAKTTPQPANESPDFGIEDRLHMAHLAQLNLLPAPATEQDLELDKMFIDLNEHLTLIYIKDRLENDDNFTEELKKS